MKTKTKKPDLLKRSRASKKEKVLDDAFYTPELVAAEFERIFQEKRNSGEIRAEKPTKEQAEQILLQIFARGVTRPEIIDD